MVATWRVATCRGLPNRAYFEPSPSPLTCEYLPCSPRTSHKVQNNLKWWYGNENCQTVFHWLLHKQFFCFKLSLPSQQSYSLRGGHWINVPLSMNKIVFNCKKAGRCTILIWISDADHHCLLIHCLTGIAFISEEEKDMLRHWTLPRKRYD